MARLARHFAKSRNLLFSAFETQDNKRVTIKEK